MTADRTGRAGNQPADLPLPEDALPAAFEVIRGVSQITPGQLLRALTAAAPALRAQGAAAERAELAAHVTERIHELAAMGWSGQGETVAQSELRTIADLLAGDAP